MVPARSPGRRMSRIVLLAVLVVAIGAVAAGVVFALDRSGVTLREKEPDAAAPVRTFVDAWAAGDLRTMYREVSPQVRGQVAFRQFEASYERAARIATLQRVRVEGPVSPAGESASVAVSARTRLFGTIRTTLVVPLVRVDDRYTVDWSRSLVFPGLRTGESLRRVATQPDRRGAILSRERMVLARGPVTAREYPQGGAFAFVTGFVRAPQTPAEAGARRAAGWDAHTAFGQGGLEASLDATLGGVPRIELLATRGEDTRRIAKRAGRRPHDVVTTLSVPVQEAAVAALGDQQGGIVVMDTRTGAVRASAGIGMDSHQAPGSTYKIVTAAAALTGGTATLESYWEPAHYVQLGGFRLRNFRGELCGGYLTETFAHSCNSAFAPIAIEAGAERMVETSVRFGFNRPATIAYPVAESLVPRPALLNSDLDLGVVGIGQGGVTATPLQMASVTQVIASGGVMHPPWIARLPAKRSDRAPSRRVIPRRVAGEIAGMMEAVVSYGTGTLAAGGLASMAGKTGTAEVGEDVKSNAWFVGYSPATSPALAVSVLIVHGGVGGEVAAPLARDVMTAALSNL